MCRLARLAPPIAILLSVLIGPVRAQNAPHTVRPGDVRSMAQPSSSQAELALVQRARKLLDRTDRWNRTDSGACPSRQTRFSIDCALEASARPGESDALAAAQQEARLVIWDLVVSKEYDHPLTDYNNDAMVGFPDVQRLLRWLETRVGGRLARHDARAVREDDPQANPPASKADLAIAREARRLLATPAAWNDRDTRDCPADAHTFSFFCGLVEASDRVTANLEMRGATMQEARFVVDSLANGRKFPHRLMDFNNDPATGFSGVQEALRLLESRLAERVRNGR
jgi:hypothetical protein